MVSYIQAFSYCDSEGNTVHITNNPSWWVYIDPSIRAEHDLYIVLFALIPGNEIFQSIYLLRHFSYLKTTDFYPPSYIHLQVNPKMYLKIF